MTSLVWPCQESRYDVFGLAVFGLAVFGLAAATNPGSVSTTPPVADTVTLSDQLRRFLRLRVEP